MRRVILILREFSLKFIQKRLQKPQDVQGPKYTPHFAGAEIRISLLFMENAIFCPGTINSLL